MDFSSIIQSLIIKNDKLVYAPDEDTFMIAKHVYDLAFGKCLEVGAGSGYTSIIMAKKGLDVTCVDINPNAIKLLAVNASENNVSLKIIESDLFSKLDSKFDTIVFNPPYLPASLLDQDDPFVASVDGGPRGWEITERFINSLNDYLSTNGQAIIIFSSLTKLSKIQEFISNNCLESVILEERNVGLMEKLYVLKIVKSKLLIELESRGIKSVKYFAHGKRGIIYTGELDGSKIAIKSHNPKSEANTINFEYEILSELNKYEIGPKVIFSGDKYFGYYFIDGEDIGTKWEKLDSVSRKKVLFSVLAQLQKLDELGFTKDEMKFPHKHILIDNSLNCYLIDFERCKKGTSAHNVTQFTNYIAGTLYPFIDKEKLFRLAKEYSKDYLVYSKLVDFLESSIK